MSTRVVQISREVWDKLQAIMKKKREHVCGIFGHDWRYNFPTLPSKAICARCEKRVRVEFVEEHRRVGTDLFVLPEQWVEGFEDKRTNRQLIQKWFK